MSMTMRLFRIFSRRLHQPRPSLLENIMEGRVSVCDITDSEISSLSWGICRRMNSRINSMSELLFRDELEELYGRLIAERQRREANQ